MSPRKRWMVAASIAAFVAANLLFVLAGARAVPRYSARYEQNCNLCHVSQTGGGMRGLYASQYLVPEELAWKVPQKSVLEGIDPEIAKNITIGADMRMIHVYSDDETRRFNFFEMQGDVYINFQMGDALSLYFDKGISSSYELYGTALVLPYNGYIKAGRFIPAYGWKFDDHTMYTREFLGFFPPGHTDVGVEFGTFPDRFALTLGVLNGSRGLTMDNNDELAAAFRAAYRFHMWGMGMSAGVSGYWNPSETRDEGAGGVFGYTTWKGLAWVGELDWIRDDPDGPGRTTGLVMSNEVSYLIRQGVELKLTHDFFDPDWNNKTGARERWGGGVYTLYNPFLGLEALVRHTSFDDGIDLSGEDFLETVVQLHFLY